MAACSSPRLSLLRVRDTEGYACVGVPPEWEVAPEPRENGAIVAAIGRILRTALGRRRRTDPRSAVP